MAVENPKHSAGQRETHLVNARATLLEPAKGKRKGSGMVDRTLSIWGVGAKMPLVVKVATTSLAAKVETTSLAAKVETTCLAKNLWFKRVFSGPPVVNQIVLTEVVVVVLVEAGAGTGKVQTRLIREGEGQAPPSVLMFLEAKVETKSKRVNLTRQPRMTPKLMFLPKRFVGFIPIALGQTATFCTQKGMRRTARQRRECADMT